MAAIAFAEAELTRPTNPAASAMPKLHRNCGRVFDAQAYPDAELAEIALLIQFDRGFYLDAYPDVAAAGVDPLRHFLATGLNEMRLPAEQETSGGHPGMDDTLGFDRDLYLTRNPDVQGDPYLHFLTFGIREFRLPFDLVENLEAERLTTRILKNAGIILERTLETPAQFEPEPWTTISEQLQSCGQSSNIPLKRYRNNYWLAMAVSLLAQGRYGASTCCYNFFFNYYVPMSWLGNGQHEIFGTGRISSTAEAIARNGDLVEILDVAGHVNVPEPVFLNRGRNIERRSRINLPRPVYGILRDVEVIGGTSLIVQSGHSVLYDYVETGERARELQCPNIIHVVGDNCSFRLPSRTVEVSEAFSLLHDHGHNYHHWLLEVLPRYLMARRQGLRDDVPLLVEGHIAPQMRQILQEVFQAEPPLVEVPRGTSAHVARLHWVSDLCVNTVHINREPARDDILFSPTAIQMIRDLAAPHFTNVPGKYDRVLVVRQNVEFRRLINREVLQTAMEAAGLWSFDPGAVGWIEQVRVFSNARLIVAEAGAALANLVFCQPGAVVIVLVNGHKNSNFFYLSQLAELVGVKLYLFECLRLTGSHVFGVQDNMIVQVSALSKWVRHFLDALGSRGQKQARPQPRERRVASV